MSLNRIEFLAVGRFSLHDVVGRLGKGWAAVIDMVDLPSSKLAMSLFGHPHFTY